MKTWVGGASGLSKSSRQRRSTPARSSPRTWTETGTSTCSPPPAPTTRLPGTRIWTGRGASGRSTAALLFLWRSFGTYTGLSDQTVQKATIVLFAAVVIAPCVALILKPGAEASNGRADMRRIAFSLLGLLYVWFLLSFILELRLLDDGSGTTRLGLQLTVVLLLSVKLGDSCAFFVGRSIGSMPMTWVSPRKTWEGAAASVSGAVAVCVLLGWAVFKFPLLPMVVFGLLTNVAGQIGDLVESLFKRRSGLKDSGVFFREIGGFLDLLDSLILAGPVGYLLAGLVL